MLLGFPVDLHLTKIFRILKGNPFTKGFISTLISTKESGTFNLTTNNMAYTNDTAEQVFRGIHEKAGFDIPEAIAIAHALTHDDDLLENLEEDQLIMVQTAAATVASDLMKLTILINKIRS